jgi:site-specific DNA recombinase
MKNRAILYVRVSTDEQADRGYSLRDQEERLIKYCELTSIEVLATYREDHSAKDFNRPEYKKLYEFAKSHKSEIDLLLVVKWDRFSRNAPDSYEVIKNFDKLGIEIQAVEQPLDLSVPENKIMLALYLTAPEVENDRRSMNTISGMRRASMEGRWVCSAPKGYSNRRDEKNKPIIVPDKNAVHIRKAFEQIAEGLKPLEHIRKELNQQGFVCSKSNFATQMRNPVYMGKLKIDAYKNEPETIVDGLHEPIIPEELFYKVQEILDGRRKRTNRPLLQRTRVELPLRGMLHCPVCDQKLTGSGSRGNGGRYFYYHCQYCHKERTRADLVEKHVVDYLKDLKINPDNREIIKKAFKVFLKGQETQSVLTHADNQVKINKVKSRIKVLQDRLADGEITAVDYQEMKQRYEQDLSTLKGQKSTINEFQVDFDKLLKRAMDMMENMDQLYVNAEFNLKRQLIGSIFTGKLYFSENRVRTTELNEAIKQIHRIDKAFRGKKKGQPQNFKQLSCWVAPTGIEPVFKV